MKGYQRLIQGFDWASVKAKMDLRGIPQEERDLLTDHLTQMEIETINRVNSKIK